MGPLISVFGISPFSLYRSWLQATVPVARYDYQVLRYVEGFTPHRSQNTVYVFFRLLSSIRTLHSPPAEVSLQKIRRQCAALGLHLERDAKEKSAHTPIGVIRHQQCEAERHRAR